MGLLDVFKGKNPEKLEAQGDLFFESGAFGQARLEYESAVGKRRKETSNDSRIPELNKKILRCSEALAAEHRNRGTDLADEGYFDEAREYYNLALDLTQDAELINALQGDLHDLETRQAKAAFEESTDADSLEPEISEQEIHEPVSFSEEGSAEVLFIAVPDEIRDLYACYGKNFENGYFALHQGRFEEAAEYLSLALEENPGPDSYVRLELATAYLNLKRHEDAIALVDGFVPKYMDMMTCRLLCGVYWDTGHWNRALTLLDSLAPEQKVMPFFCGLRGETLFRAGKYRQAESLYRDFLEKCGWDPNIANALAQTCEALGDSEGARELYGKVIASCSGCGTAADPQTLRKYADLCMETGVQDKRLLEIYLALADKDPEISADCYRKVSKIYEALGHEKEARRFRQIALRYEDTGDGS